MTHRIFPIGVQTFSEIIEKNMIYVDKTEYVYRITHKYNYVFLNRPRRFGKSMLASTLKCYFEGNKELFQGLAIDKLEKDWNKYPVLHFDMSTAKYTDENSLRAELNLKLLKYEKIYGHDEAEKEPNERLLGVIKRAYAQTGQQVVVIIDEYDAPLLDVVHESTSLEGLRQIILNFYSPLKACDPYLRFVFITGITKFSQLSIFSGLNNLTNISMDPPYSGICGITKDELHTQLAPAVEDMAEALRISVNETYERLRLNYDGYHFSDHSEDVFNPFSIINALDERRIRDFWFASGTPTYLIKMIQLFHTDITKIDFTQAAATTFDAPTETMTNIIPLLYQSGISPSRIIMRR